MQPFAQQQTTQIHQRRTIQLQRGNTAPANAGDPVDAQSVSTPGEMPRPAITPWMKQAKGTTGHRINSLGLVGLVRIAAGTREGQVGRIRAASGRNRHDMLDAITTRREGFQR